MPSIYDLRNMLKPVAAVGGFHTQSCSSFKSELLRLSQWTGSFVSEQMFHCLALWCKVASVEVGTLAASFEFSPIECRQHQPPPFFCPPPQATQRGALPLPRSPLTPCRPHHYYYYYIPPLRAGALCLSNPHPPPHTDIKSQFTDQLLQCESVFATIYI